MRKIAIKHNKRRNVGIVYEMLVRCVSEAALDESRGRADTAMRILKKYFGKGQPLAQEYAVHQAIMGSRGRVGEKLARRIIAEAVKAASELDKRLCEIKKSNLIKELNYGFGKDFFDQYRIPEYRALASIHMLIQSSGAARSLNEKIDRATLEESIIRFMCAPVHHKTEIPDEDRNALTLKLASATFAKRYGEVLLPEQKTLMDAYTEASLSGNRRVFRETAERERDRLVRGLESYGAVEDCLKDPILSERVAKVRDDVLGMRLTMNEQCLEDLMLVCGILHEMRSK